MFFTWGDFPRIFCVRAHHDPSLIFQFSCTSIQVWAIQPKNHSQTTHSECNIQGSHASWKVLDFFVKFRGPGKSWKMDLVLESPGNISVRSWKVMEFLLGYDAGGRHNGVGVGADADICTCTHLVCYFSVTVINVCLNVDAVIIRCIYM